MRFRAAPRAAAPRPTAPPEAHSLVAEDANLGGGGEVARVVWAHGDYKQRAPDIQRAPFLNGPRSQLQICIEGTRVPRCVCRGASCGVHSVDIERARVCSRSSPAMQRQQTDFSGESRHGASRAAKQRRPRTCEPKCSRRRSGSRAMRFPTATTTNSPHGYRVTQRCGLGAAEAAGHTESNVATPLVTNVCLAEATTSGKPSATMLLSRQGQTRRPRCERSPAHECNHCYTVALRRRRTNAPKKHTDACACFTTVRCETLR